MSKLSALRLVHRGSRYGSEIWSDLNGKIVKNPTVILQGFGDIHPYRSNEPRFLANKIFIHNCDKNFVYYWVSKDIFPNIKELYLLSHPCEPCVLRQEIPYIYLANWFSRYKNRWADDRDNVILKDSAEMLDEMNSYKEEELVTEDIPKE